MKKTESGCGGSREYGEILSAVKPAHCVVVIGTRTRSDDLEFASLLCGRAYA